MARDQPPWVNWTQYLALRGLVTFMHCFDVEPNLATAAGVGRLFCRLLPRHHNRAIENLSRSFPDWPAERINEVASRSVQNMFQLIMVDAMVMPRLITASSWPRYLHIGRLQSAMERLIRNEPTLFITGHVGNWELLGYSLVVLGYPLYALARPLDNPLLNDWIMGIREARGMHIITKFGATPALQKVMRTGGRIAFIADQNAGIQGLFVPFFGRLASSYKSIGLLAMRYRVPIAVGFAHRINGRFEYKLTVNDVIQPDDWKSRPDPLFYITARYNRSLEMAIRAEPEQYLWAHRRWKSRPRHERMGRPVPGNLVAKLESLPWLTPSEVDRIVETSNEAARQQADR